MLALPLLMLGTFCLLFALGMYVVAPTTITSPPNLDEPGSSWVAMQCADCSTTGFAWQNHWLFALPLVRSDLRCAACKSK